MNMVIRFWIFGIVASSIYQIGPVSAETPILTPSKQIEMDLDRCIGKASEAAIKWYKRHKGVELIAVPTKGTVVLTDQKTDKTPYFLISYHELEISDDAIAFYFTEYNKTPEELKTSEVFVAKLEASTCRVYGTHTFIPNETQ